MRWLNVLQFRGIREVELAADVQNIHTWGREEHICNGCITDENVCFFVVFILSSNMQIKPLWMSWWARALTGFRHSWRLRCHENSWNDCLRVTFPHSSSLMLLSGVFIAIHNTFLMQTLRNGVHSFTAVLQVSYSGKPVGEEKKRNNCGWACRG